MPYSCKPARGERGERTEGLASSTDVVSKCGRQYVVVGEHPRKVVTQEAMSGDAATWNSWRGWDLSREPNLTGADLRRADLPRADLSRANLARAELSEADLMSANLQSANLLRAILFRADLMGA